MKRLIGGLSPLKPFLAGFLVVLDGGILIAEGVEGSPLLAGSATDGAFSGSEVVDVLIIVGNAEMSLAFRLTRTFAHKLSNITHEI